MKKILKDFFSDTRGSILLPLLFTFAFVFGSMALAVDSLRYFSVQSLLEKSALSAAIFAAKNSETLSLSEVRHLAEEIAQLEFVGGSQSFLQSASLDTIHVSQTNAGSTTTVKLVGSLSTTLMQAFNYSNKLLTETRVVTSSGLENLEIALIVDRSENANAAGLIENATDAAKLLVSHIQKLSASSSGSVKVGIVPKGSSLMNVGSRKYWVENTDWPIDIPPNVPGVKVWSGPLEDQRWCVGIRDAEISSDFPPSSHKFPLILAIEKTDGATSQQDVYSIATQSDCSEASVQPLTTNHGALISYLASLKPNGLAATGSAFAWAERLLSPEWHMDWNVGTEIPANYNSEIVKTVILINASDPGNDTRQQQLLIGSCDRMKSNGIRVYILDYDISPSPDNELKACATAEHYYFLVAGKDGLISAMKDIVKSLVSVRVVQIGSN